MTADDVIAAVRGALRKYPSAKPLRTVQDAQREAAKAARAANRILMPELAGMTADERRRVLFESLRETNRAALEAAARMQRSRAETYGESDLGIAEPQFDSQRARNLSTYADTLFAEAEDGELTEEQQHALADTIENNARLCVDDAERELADARYEMGKRAMIVRSALGANSCEWCLSAAGEYEYGPAMDKSLAFGRHANCDCLIEYHPGTGRIETVRNYRIPDKDRARLR